MAKLFFSALAYVGAAVLVALALLMLGAQAAPWVSGSFARGQTADDPTDISRLELSDAREADKGGEPPTALAFPEPPNAKEPNASTASVAPSAAAQQTGSSSSAAAPPNTAQSGATVARISEPYAFQPKGFSLVDAETRAALVNIYCTLTRGGARSAYSGSGVFVDPRGIILTNAHVAQYFLLAGHNENDAHCVIRSGSPAAARWNAQLLYIPKPWVEEHAEDIRKTRSIGTGEHDYALLYVTGAADGSPLPGAFPHLAPDTREAIGFQDDPVLVAAYPAEFIGGAAAQHSLHPSSSVGTIKTLMTFGSKLIDLLSLGGTPLAQGGASGGAVVNAWGRLIGVVVTTSEGATTGERDLRAISLAHIDRSLRVHAGVGLAALLALEPNAARSAYFAPIEPALSQRLREALQ
ncbi:hypothetical protein COU20_03095 [Candidatus Kaiserbacteria bacterium CG10_big_fil_rev_8_21_14_0_10_59_10]|uniref:Serine protease n=1 Tax=Candidatus Kaiserbacteria bacterium CG10_big_fil_rev_8_21_14_0_10_59_10 TaxID=1974612 RepID=A0A2H0U7J9_9BACT|nr:MAG: hypothetical protein COU20_03095 [Candidatus Kaiserbacteria bacterium CG10_big_fil_rev_8_21_14_0_10_59_10]